MVQKAKVLERKEDKMKVEVVRNGSCSSNCASCKGCSAGQKKIIIDIPHDGYSDKGDVINIEVETSKVLGLSYITYIVPLFTMLLGYFLGAKVSEIMGIVGAFAGLAVPIPVLVFISKKIKNNFFDNIKTKL
ncbi:MAG: SoxR reducing system RseC family protein [Clostridia bacterium]|nr:SoxR reducing system RseC family protein [Clostridia bacterium]MBR5265602.1 SoxR reducing system RseC family protein [Clostridia bacterium]